MVINYFNNSDGRDGLPIQPAVWFARERLVVRGEDETNASMKLDGELSGSVPAQLMAPSRQSPHDREVGRRVEIVQSRAQLLRAWGAELPLRESSIVAESLDSV
ncbi:MAG: hypothetical protein H0X67_13560 [Acidobacteria bacterium]|nr:hypothetical protein [Acidobacteriota bacterium]